MRRRAFNFNFTHSFLLRSLCSRIFTCTVDCNLNYSDSGTLTSPDYPYAYAGGLDCTYTLRASSPDHVIQLDITDLNIEENAGCLQSFLEVCCRVQQVSLADWQMR